MNRNEAIAYLTRCADDNGNHWYEGRIWAMSNCPNDISTCPICKGTNDAGHTRADSVYGTYSVDCAAVAYRHAKIVAHEGGWELTTESLDHSMSLVVNGHEDVGNDIQQYAAEIAGADVDAMVNGYLECQLWAQSDMERADENGNGPMLDDNYGVDDIDSEYVDKVRAEFADLVAAHPLAIRMFLARLGVHGRSGDGLSATDANEQFGHDFYLTREHHGAGFWDRGLGELGNYLTDIAHYAGSADDLWDNGSGVLA